MIPEGYRLLTAEDIGKVFGVDLESVAYVYFENDYADFPSFWSSQKQLTDFMTYEYVGDLGGAFVSFDSGIVSGADNLWLNVPSSFEYCTIAEGTRLTIFNTDADWNTWFYVRDIGWTDPYSIKIKNKEGIKLLTKDKTIEFTDDVKVTIDESLLGGGGETQGTVKALFDAKKSCYREFGDSKITSEELEKVLSYSDTSQVTDMQYMFYNCTELIAIPQLDTSQVTNMGYMFRGCRKLTTVPQLDASNVTSMYAMFRECVKLTEAPLLLNSNKVKDVVQMFYNCSELVTVPALDMSGVTSTTNMFYQCSKLKHVLFTGIRASFDISASTQFEREDLLVILNNLASGVIATLTMGSTNLAKLTAADKAIATNKSWTLK